VPYVVLLKPAAQREVDRLRGVAHVAVRGVILAMADEPRPLGSRKLAGREDLWRLRFRIDGRAWRLIYRVDDKQRLVVITRVARRNEGTYPAI
jgi:mRNA interferase RelE/StbE